MSRPLWEGIEMLADQPRPARFVRAPSNRVTDAEFRALASGKVQPPLSLAAHRELDELLEAANKERP